MHPILVVGGLLHVFQHVYAVCEVSCKIVIPVSVIRVMFSIDM